MIVIVYFFRSDSHHTRSISQVYSSVTEVEQSVDSVTVVFFKSIDPPATVDEGVGKSVSIDVLVSKDSSSTYSFSWTKDGEIYSAFSYR